MTPLLLVHGWGFSASFWDPLLIELDWPGPVQCVDLGFFGKDVYAAVDESALVIGHSLGVMWALQHVRVQALVSVNGFGRFSSAPDFPCGIPARILERMIAKCRVDSAAVLREFRLNAGCAVPFPDHGDTARLVEGLEWLKQWDVRARLAGLPLLSLAARDDGIAPQALIRSCFPASEFSDEGGHVLPLSRPRWLADRIRPFLKELT